MSIVVEFLSGGIMLGCLIIAVFFLKFWRQSRDRLFGFFAIAFAVLALERVVLLFFANQEGESVSAIYLLRLLAFGLILIGIADKNRGNRAAARDSEKPETNHRD